MFPAAGLGECLMRVSRSFWVVFIASVFCWTSVNAEGELGLDICTYEFVAEPKDPSVPEFVMHYFKDDFFIYFFDFLMGPDGALTEKAFSQKFLSMSFMSGPNFKKTMSITVVAAGEEGRSRVRTVLDEMVREMLWGDYEFEVIAEPLECRFLECDDAYCDGYSLYWN